MAHGLLAAVLINLVLAGCFSVLYKYLPNLKKSEISSNPITPKDVLSNSIVKKVIEFNSINKRLNELEDNSEEDVITNLKRTFMELQEMMDNYDKITGHDILKDQQLNVIDTSGRQVRLLVIRRPVERGWKTEEDEIEGEGNDGGDLEQEEGDEGDEEEFELEEEEEVELFWFISPRNSSVEEDTDL